MTRRDRLKQITGDSIMVDTGHTPEEHSSDPPQEHCPHSPVVLRRDHMCRYPRHGGRRVREEMSQNPRGVYGDCGRRVTKDSTAEVPWRAGQELKIQIAQEDWD